MISSRISLTLFLMICLIFVGNFQQQDELLIMVISNYAGLELLLSMVFSFYVS